MIRRVLATLTLPSEVSEFEERHLRRMNRIALVFFMAHLPALMGVAFLSDTGVLRAVLYTATVLVGPAIAYRAFESQRAISMVFGLAAMSLGGLLVHFGQGPMQIEMHFYFFVLLALLAVLGNPMVIVVAALTVALHHLILFLVLPSSVFNYRASLWVVLVHAGFVVLETIATCFVARSFFDNVVGLEQIVAARTDELRRETDERKKTEALIAETRIRDARSAGMAEVATGVLHNVGNALNSVGVSAEVIGDKLRRSRLAGLGKANGLLAAHASDLAVFLSEHPQGKQLPAYLARLGAELEQEQRDVATELEGLRKGITHMTVIVGTQQALAKGARRNAGTEPHKPSAIFREALDLALSSADRAQLDLKLDFKANDTAAVDHHRLIQILINLITNARHALVGLPAGQRRLELGVRVVEGRLRFEVKDNGTGISPEQKVKIFSHGFTTRSDGHGFGLHASACAAMEMGGTLSCHSEGSGHGSTFTIDLPHLNPTQLEEAA